MAKRTNTSVWISWGLSTAAVFGGLLFFSVQLRHWFGLPASVIAETSLLEGNYERAIADSTAMIDLNPGSFLAADAFNRRGLAYQGRGEIARAIDDYDEAIRRKPAFAEAYYNRCIALRRKGDADRALADCQAAADLQTDYYQPRDVVVQLLLRRGDIAAARTKIDELVDLRRTLGNPSVLDSRFYRGQIRLFYDNHPAAAAEDFVAALASAVDYRISGGLFGPQTIDGVAVSDLMASGHAFIPDAYYLVLWLRIARVRAQQNYGVELDENIASLGAPIRLKLMLKTFENTTDKVTEATLQPWPGPLLALYIGKTLPDDIRKAVEKVDDPIIRQRRSCEVDFYLGEYAFERGAKTEAQRQLEAAAAGCPTETRERSFAKAELERLNGTVSK